MSRYIDADKFEKRAYEVAYPIIHDTNSHERGLTLIGIAQLLDEQPTADVRENIKGEWTKEAGYVAGDREWKCSVCGETFWNGSMDRYHFCPNCGADMRREENGRDEENHNRV